MCVCARPPLAGDHAHLLHLPLCRQLSGLPPLVVRGVHHVQDVPEAEVEPLAGEAGVSGALVVKQRPERTMAGVRTGQQGWSLNAAQQV